MNLLEFGYIAWLFSKEFNCQKNDSNNLEEFLYEIMPLVEEIELDSDSKKELFNDFEKWLHEPKTTLEEKS